MKNILIGLVVVVIVSVMTSSLVYFSIGKPAVQFKGADSFYVATSTAANSAYGAFTGDQLLKTGQGVLGSIVITGANTGIVNFYNATTSSVLLRTGQKASSSILMASFPASTAAGTYTLDAVFTDGLLLELETGNIPTTTITYQ